MKEVCATLLMDPCGSIGQKVGMMFIKESNKEVASQTCPAMPVYDLNHKMAMP